MDALMSDSGQKGDMCIAKRHVCFTLESGHVVQWHTGSRLGKKYETPIGLQLGQNTSTKRLEELDGFERVHSNARPPFFGVSGQ
jgi:hypothetical protein